MKRTVSAMILLAALGGCSSAQQDSDGNKRVVYDYRQQQVPRPADPSWTPNMLASNGSAPAGYTRVGSTAALSDSGSPISKLTAPALPAADKVAPAKPPANALALRDGVGDPAPFEPAMSSPGPRGDARAADLLGNGPSLKLPAAPNTDTITYLPPPGTSKPKDADGLVTSSYLPSKLPEPLDSHVLNPAVRVINNKRITLNYKINDVGPSGVSGIDVWVTQNGRAWKKLDVGTQTHPPCVVEVSEEGTYGFTLVARNGLGLGKAPPQAGDVPQVWVEVDLSKPDVHLLGVDNSANGKASVIVRWSATDKNLGPKPIALSYLDQGRGLWTPIAANLENTGRYVWPIPSNVTGRLLMRVEATDLAGNVGTARSQEAFLVDNSQPSIAILNVEGSR